MCMICWDISCNTKLRSHKDAALAAWLLGRYISLEMIWQCAVCLYVCVCFCVVLFWYFFACVFMFVHLCYSVFVSLCLRFRVCVSVCLCFVWKHTGRKHREKTQTENTEREHREETQRENTHRKHRQYKRFCGGVFVVYGWVFELKASKMNFHRTSFQNERFARGFLKISQKKLPKWSFRARLPPNFREKASKRIVSCEASSKFHRTILPKRAFRAMLPTISAENLRFATVSRDRHTDSCERVHPPNHKCASHYSAAHSQMWQCAFRYSAVHKNVWIYRPWTDLLRANKNVRFYYSFGRSTPRF